MALPLTPPSVAMMVDVLSATEVASPVVETVANVVLLDVQVAEAVTSEVVVSEKVATALNCCVWFGRTHPDEPLLGDGDRRGVRGDSA